MKCSVSLCEETPWCKCTCAEEELILCNTHRFHHMSTEGNHILEDIPGNSLLQSKQIELCSSFTSSEFLLSEFDNRLIILSLETTECPLPKNILHCLDSMNDIFLKKLLKLEWNFSRDAPKICENFLFAIKQVLPSCSIDCLQFTVEIVNRLTSLYATSAEVFAPLIEKLISQLKKELNMPDTIRKNLFYTVNLKAAENDFYYEILQLKEFASKNVYPIFESKFQGFYNAAPYVKGHFNNLEKEYRAKELENQERWRAEIINFTKDLYSSTSYSEVVVNLYEKDLDYRRESLGIQMQFKKIFQRILHTGNFKINQVIDISHELFFTIVEIDIKKTYIIKVNQEESCIVMSLDSENVVIASGSVKDRIIIFQNYPRKYFTCRLHKNKEIEDSLINLDIETYSSITSAVFIESTGFIICSTTEGIIFSNDSTCKDRLTHLTNSERCITMKYHSNAHLLSLVTDTHLIFLSSSLRLLYKFRIYGQPVELLLKNNLLIFYNTDSSLTSCNILMLSDSDISCLNEELRRLEVPIIERGIRYIKSLTRQKVDGEYNKIIKKIKVELNILPGYPELMMIRGEPERSSIQEEKKIYSEDLNEEFPLRINNSYDIPIVDIPTGLNYESKEISREDSREEDKEEYVQ